MWREHIPDPDITMVEMDYENGVMKHRSDGGPVRVRAPPGSAYVHQTLLLVQPHDAFNTD